MKKHTNMVHPCPFQGFAYLRDYPIETSLPIFNVPYDKYMVQHMLYTKINGQEKLFINMQIFFELISG